jgi:hypothetical protein
MIITLNGSAALACALLAIVCTFLVMHHDYDDGIVGRIALGVIAFCCYLVAWDVYKCNDNFNFHPATTLIMWAVLVFMVRHTCRFLRALRCANCKRDMTGLRRHGDDPKGFHHAKG